MGIVVSENLLTAIEVLADTAGIPSTAAKEKAASRKEQPEKPESRGQRRRISQKQKRLGVNPDDGEAHKVAMAPADTATTLADTATSKGDQGEAKGTAISKAKGNATSKEKAKRKRKRKQERRH